MQAIRSRDTKPELEVRSLLHRHGLRFRVCQRPLPQVPRSADIVFRRAKVSVFIDGCFWHGCPDHYRPPKTNADYWLPKIARNRARDDEIDQILVQAGWVVVRAWEHEDTEEIAHRIELEVASRRHIVGRHLD